MTWSRPAKRFWGTVAAAHLGLTILGASQIRFPGEWLARFHDGFDVYGMVTGAGFGFNYFAPEIGSELGARFEIEGTDGTRIEDRLETRAGREASLRIYNIIGLFSQSAPVESERRKLAASWAGKMFARHRDARRVTLVVESYELPSLFDYPSRREAGWTQAYRATFVRRASKERASRDGT